MAKVQEGETLAKKRPSRAYALPTLESCGGGVELCQKLHSDIVGGRCTKKLLVEGIKLFRSTFYSLSRTEEEKLKGLLDELELLTPN